MVKKIHVQVPELELPGELRVLVCGGRAFSDGEILDCTLKAFDALHPIALLIHGGADGADNLAGTWARRHGVTVTTFQADWNTHGRAAGPFRNEEMLKQGRPDIVIAFPGGHGTSQMIRLARRHGVVVWKPIPFDEMPPKRWERRGLAEARQEYLRLPAVTVLARLSP